MMMARWCAFWIPVASVVVWAGCGGGGSTGRPDMGYGANQPLPATETCAVLCQRIADCTADLCDEDSGTTNYLSIEPELATACEQGCTDGEVQSSISPARWQCTFQSTCRQLLSEDACQGMGHYSC